MLCFPLLDVRRQFAAATRFQFLYHVRAELGNQTENMPGRERFKTLPIYCMADRHIAGKVQQSFIHILRAQFRPHRAGRKDCKPIFTLSNKEVPFLHLLFYVLLQLIADLIPARQPPQGIAEYNCLLAGKSLQRQLGQIPIQQLAGKEGSSALIPNYHRGARMAFFCGPIKHILDALICVFQYFGVSIRFMYQIITVIYTIALW